MELSEQKAKEVAGMVKAYESGHEKLMTPQDILVIGADTIVACDDTILGKPKDEAGAKRMLKLLSGRKHAVYTGVTFVFLDKNGRAGAHTFYEKTCAIYIEGIEGDYNNVVGLPVARIYKELQKLGIDPYLW